MAEASVTIKLNPVEFDLIRGSINVAFDLANEVVADMSASANDRSKARSKAVQLKDLGAKLGA